MSQVCIIVDIMLLYCPGRAVTAQRLLYFYIDNTVLQIAGSLRLLDIIALMGQTAVQSRTYNLEENLEETATGRTVNSTDMF